jgi:phosphatidylglycerophosphate synthase
MLSGICSGIFFANGSRTAFMLGSLLYGIATVLDCCDGMVARLKKNGTKTGRILDGLVDYLSSGAVYVGLGIGLSSAAAQGSIALPLNAWVLILLAAISTALHGIYSDYYRNAYLEQCSVSKAASGSDELQIFSAELEQLKKTSGHVVDKALIRIYLVYLRLQTRKRPRQNPAPAAPVSRRKVVLWNLIGTSMHISFLIAAALLYRPMVFFAFTIVAANLWLILLLVAERVTAKPIAQPRF